MNTLKSKIEELLNNSEYKKAADFLIKELKAEIKINGWEFKSMHWDEDGQKRYVFNCSIIRGPKEFTFDFGTSIVNSCEKHSEWDLLNPNDEIELFIGMAIQLGREKENSVHGSTKLKASKSCFEDPSYELIENTVQEIIRDFEKNKKLKRNKITSRFQMDEFKLRDHVKLKISDKVNEMKRTYTYSKNVPKENPVLPDAYSLITALSFDNPYTFEDFCSNFGYDNDSIKDLRIYEAVKKEYEALSNIFNEEEMELLQSIR